jgi:hypothetical protein
VLGYNVYYSYGGLNNLLAVSKSALKNDTEVEEDSLSLAV